MERLSNENAVTRMFCHNVETDAHLYYPLAQLLVQVLADASMRTQQVRETLVELFRANILRSASFVPYDSLDFGWAIWETTFYVRAEELGIWESEDQGREIMRTLFESDITYTHMILGGHKLGQYLMWATFNESGRGPHDSTVAARQLAGMLGLADLGTLARLLTFEYRLDGTTEPHVPTIAEAYASTEWPFHFLPSVNDERKFGFTKPTDPYKRYPGLPEVVHRPVDGDQLVRTPRVRS